MRGQSAYSEDALRAATEQVAAVQAKQAAAREELERLKAQSMHGVEASMTATEQVLLLSRAVIRDYN